MSTKMRTATVAAVVAVAASGCSLSLAGGAATHGGLQAGGADTAVEQLDELTSRADALSGRGAGRIPPTTGCPADVGAVRSVTEQLVRASTLTADERVAFDVLLRSARLCDPALSGVPALSTFVAN